MHGCRAPDRCKLPDVYTWNTDKDISLTGRQYISQGVLEARELGSQIGVVQGGGWFRVWEIKGADPKDEIALRVHVSYHRI